MDIKELGSIISDFVRVGYNCAIADYDPPQDKLRESEVKEWLRFRKMDFRSFRLLVKKGLIHARRSGTAVNSPMVYSKAEIQKAMATMRVERFTNELI